MIGDWRKLLKRRGDAVTAEEWNDLVRLAARAHSGPGVMQDAEGSHQRKLKGQSTGVAGTAQFAKIPARAGASPPYRYSASEATMDVDGAWTTVSGGLSYNNLFNVEEQGDGGQWVNPLLVDDVVTIFAAPDPGVDAYVCTRSHYRGAY